MAGVLNDVLTFCSKVQKMVKDVQSIVHQVVSVAEYVSSKEHICALFEQQRFACARVQCSAVIPGNTVHVRLMLMCAMCSYMSSLQVFNNDPYKLASN